MPAVPDLHRSMMGRTWRPDIQEQAIFADILHISQLRSSRPILGRVPRIRPRDRGAWLGKTRWRRIRTIADALEDIDCLAAIAANLSVCGGGDRMFGWLASEPHERRTECKRGGAASKGPSVHRQVSSPPCFTGLAAHVQIRLRQKDFHLPNTRSVVISGHGMLDRSCCRCEVYSFLRRVT